MWVWTPPWARKNGMLVQRRTFMMCERLAEAGLQCQTAPRMQNFRVEIGSGKRVEMSEGSKRSKKSENMGLE